MKNLITLLVAVFAIVATQANTLEELTFGTDSTLDIVTWNIEHFPNTGDVTVEYVKEMIYAMDAEVYAIQEVEDTVEFNQMLREMDGYDGFYGNYYYISLAYIYKSDLITVNSKEELFYGDWTTFPRPPYLIDITYKGEDYVIINNHLKCCNDGAERRENANNELKEYIDDNLSTEKVIVLGDMNDVLEDAVEYNVFQSYIDDVDNYYFSDMHISNGSSDNWSYPSWPSHLDHIMITNELFNLASEAQIIMLEDYMNSSSDYKNKVSDHRPVGINIKESLTTDIDFNQPSIGLDVSPNPFVDNVTISLPPLSEDSEVVIFNALGTVIYEHGVIPNQSSLSLSDDDLPVGVSLLLIRANDKVYSAKLIKQ